MKYIHRSHESSLDAVQIHETDKDEFFKVQSEQSNSVFYTAQRVHPQYTSDGCRMVCQDCNVCFTNFIGLTLITREKVWEFYHQVVQESTNTTYLEIGLPFRASVKEKLTALICWSLHPSWNSRKSYARRASAEQRRQTYQGECRHPPILITTTAW